MAKELTDAFIQALKPPATGRIEVRDTRVPGFSVRITKTGTTSFYIRKWLKAGRPTRILVAHWPAVSLKRARELALTQLAAVAQGRDPVGERRAEREAREAALAEHTVRERLLEWQQARIAANAWTIGYAKEVARICAKRFEPVLGHRALRSTTRAEWVSAITADRARAPSTATWAYLVASSFFVFAEAHGWVDASPLPRKALSIVAPPPAARTRFLTDDEVRDLWQATAERLRARPRAFVRLLLLTGCRNSEAAGLRWEELDLATGRWRLPAERAKNKTAHIMSLGELALRELLAIAPEHPQPRDYVLGAKPSGPLHGQSDIKKTLDANLSFQNWVFHDLRRTTRSGMSKLGIPRDVAELAINHRGSRAGLVGVYDRHDFGQEIVNALLTWQRHVAEVVAPSAEVIRLRA
jgi:integrase